MKLEKLRVLPIIKAALREDIGKGDITTSAVIGKLDSSKAVVTAKEDCVVCGLEVAEWLMTQIDYSVRFRPNAKDGTSVGAGKELIFLEGHTASILRAERSMLNFLSFLSGIATQTRLYADKTKPFGVKILDTRKTLPLLRYLEKYAVYTGGGANHRMGLYDQVLVKDNHIKEYREPRPRNKGRGRQSTENRVKKSLAELVRLARRENLKGTVVEIEVATIEEFNDALAGNPDIVMLDNMRSNEVKACVEIIRLAKIKPVLEASGSITLDNIEEYAKTKVDTISIGSLTSSVKSIDMSLELI